jgi:hypothetical protein
MCSVDKKKWVPVMITSGLKGLKKKNPVKSQRMNFSKINWRFIRRGKTNCRDTLKMLANYHRQGKQDEPDLASVVSKGTKLS